MTQVLYPTLGENRGCTQAKAGDIKVEEGSVSYATGLVLRNPQTLSPVFH